MRAGATRNRNGAIWITQIRYQDTSGFRGAVNHLQESRILDAVVNVAPFPARRDNASVAQGHEMLRDVGLSQLQSGLQMAHADFTGADYDEDSQPVHLADRAEQFGRLSVGMKFGGCFYIRLHEYIVNYFASLW